MTVDAHRHDLRHGTAATWTAANPILAAAELGYETDTGNFKIGDGVTHWASLGYWEPANIAAAITAVATNLTSEASRATTAEAALKAALRYENAVTVYTANISSRSGLPTNDGVTHTDGQIVLLTAQTTGSQNGLWAVHSGAWTRPTNYATGADASGMTVLVEAGTLHALTQWSVSGGGPYVIDTNATNWIQQTGSAVVLTTSSGTLGADTNTGVNGTFGDILATGSLAVGTWDVTFTVTFTRGSTTTTFQVVAGTATATLAGASATSINGTSGTGQSEACIRTLVTVTSAGTVKLQATTGDTNASTVKKNPVAGTASATGYAAVKVA